MLLSRRHHFAFIHVPKTGGSSVAVALWPYADADAVDAYWANRWLSRIGIHVNHYAPSRFKKFRTHTSAAILCRELPAAEFDRLFTFGFVRNPWSLLVSYYHYLVRNRGHHRGRVAQRMPSFEAYVDYEIARGKISQSRMLTDAQGRLLVDFVGRFESLESDFASICGRIGIQATLGHMNSSGSRDYRRYYTDDLADRVGRHFAEDAGRFGYAFDRVVAAPAEARPRLTA